MLTGARASRLTNSLRCAMRLAAMLSLPLAFFLMMAEQHEQKPGKHQELRVSMDAFLLSLRQGVALDEVQRLRKVLRRKWKNATVSALFKTVPKDYHDAPVNAGQLSDALKSIGLFVDGTQTMRLARRRGGGRIVWMQDVLLRILAGYGHYLRTLTWDLTAKSVLKHEARSGLPCGGSITSASEDDSPRKNHRRSFSAPPAKSSSQPGLVVDRRSDQADSSPTLTAQVTKPRHHTKDLVHGKHSSPVKFSPHGSTPKRNLMSESAAVSAASDGKKLSISIAADLLKQKLPPRDSDAAVAAPLKTEKLPRLPSIRQAEGGPPTALEAMSRPSTTPALPPVKEMEPNSSRPATSGSTQEAARSPWWGSTGTARSPRFAASQTGPSLLAGINPDEKAKERDRQLRAQQWAQVGARIGAVPADSPLLKPSSANGSSASGGKSPAL